MNFNLKRPSLPQFFAIFLCLVLFSGCASVSVKETRQISPAPQKLPTKIFVRGFDTPHEAFRVDRDGENLRNFRVAKQERLTRNIVRRLSDRVAPAEAIATTAPVPQGDFWLLEGKFTRVNQGSRALRMLFGFGFGGTKVETIAVLSDLSGREPREILEIETTGGTNAEPGAIAGITPLGMGVNAFFAMRGGLVFDTVRTSREIVAAISEYAAKQGLKPAEDALRPKRKGKITHPISVPLPWHPRDVDEPEAAPAEPSS